MLAEEHGHPFNQIPTRMFWSQRGGVAGWGSICGAITPAAALISFISDEETQMRMVNELMAFYQQAPFPMFQPAGQNIKQTVADSTLCHVSITKWFHEAGLRQDSPEKGERCGGLSADVAAFTITMLNAHADGTFEPQYAPAAVVGECMDCHGAMVQGKENCVSCHTDPQPSDLHKEFMP